MMRAVFGLALCAMLAVVSCEEPSAYSTGYSKGYELGYAHVHRVAASGEPTSFLEMASSLAPLFDDYVDLPVEHHHHHHVHAHGTRPVPEVDMEDEFLSGFAQASGTRPVAGSPVKHVEAKKRTFPATHKPQHTKSAPSPKHVVNAQVASKLHQDDAPETPVQEEPAVESGEAGEGEAAGESGEVVTEGEPEAAAAPLNSDAEKLAEQDRKIAQLEKDFQTANRRLEMYETSQDAMAAGAGGTDASGKTEFIRGYEGGFKVGYEAGWNMATADLKKRYGFPDMSGHSEPNRNATNNLNNLTSAPNNVLGGDSVTTTTTTTTEVQEQPPAAMQFASAPAVATEQAPASPTEGGSQTMSFLRSKFGPEGRDNMFTNNNPFFNKPQQQQPQQQPQQQQQLQAQQQYQDALTPQYEQPMYQTGGFDAMAAQQAQQAQAMQQQVMQQPQMQAQQQPLVPQMVPQSLQQPFSEMQKMFSNVDQQPHPAGLPGKAFNFLSNIKGMIMEGKNTVNAVRDALRDGQQPILANNNNNMQLAQMQQMQQVPQLQQQMQQMQPNMQQAQPFQSLMQTESQPEAADNNGDLLSGLAGLLGGNSAQDLGLTNLAQLLATTTGNQALPKTVSSQPGQDSASLGMQEMQNMIEEGQHPVR